MNRVFFQKFFQHVSVMKSSESVPFKTIYRALHSETPKITSISPQIFETQANSDKTSSTQIQSEEDLQGEWKMLENRVLKRKLKLKQDHPNLQCRSERRPSAWVNFLIKFYHKSIFYSTLGWRKHLSGDLIHKMMKLIFSFSKKTQDTTFKMNKPGFGWTKSSDEADDCLIIPGNQLALESRSTLDDYLNFPSLFLSENFPNESDKFNSDFQARLYCSVEDYFYQNSLVSELDEVKLNSRSNGRKLRWDIMKISPNTAFRLHAHPNIEVIYVLEGRINEYRFSDPILPKKVFSEIDVIGPDLSQTCPTFQRREVFQDNFLINEKGSIHLTFTEEIGAVLLVLWGMGHANLPPAHLPPPGSLPPLPTAVRAYQPPSLTSNSSSSSTTSSSSSASGESEKEEKIDEKS